MVGQDILIGMQPLVLFTIFSIQTMKYLLLLLYVMILSSCNKIYYYPDKDLGKPQPLFLAHAGGGNCGFQSNTLKAAQYGLQHFDGIELDIQMSKNNTLWLAHDPELPAYGKFVSICFRSAENSYIDSLNDCLPAENRISKLEEVFSYMAAEYALKFVSLDVKAWSPCNGSNYNILRDMNILADQIIKLKNKYHLMHLMVESETADFLNYLKENSSGIECYLTTMGDFERGMGVTLNRKLDGISFKYNYKEVISANHVRMLHKKGIKIQTWTIDSEEDLKLVHSFSPDFIQTDNIDYKKSVTE